MNSPQQREAEAHHEFNLRRVEGGTDFCCPEKEKPMDRYNEIAKDLDAKAEQLRKASGEIPPAARDECAWTDGANHCGRPRLEQRHLSWRSYTHAKESYSRHPFTPPATRTWSGWVCDGCGTPPAPEPSLRDGTPKLRHRKFHPLGLPGEGYWGEWSLCEGGCRGLYEHSMALPEGDGTGKEET